VAGDDLDTWLDERDVPEGTPFLISPALEYDIDLNRYFLAPVMAGAAHNTLSDALQAGRITAAESGQRPGQDLRTAASTPVASPFDRRVLWVGGIVFAVLMALSPRYGFDRRSCGQHDLLRAAGVGGPGAGGGQDRADRRPPLVAGRGGWPRASVWPMTTA
jgi:hypothetical protein